jgi:hypothetical protein
MVGNKEMLYTTALQSALECSNMKIQENQMRLNLNEIHEILAYPDEINVLGGNIDITKKKSTETLIYASKEAGIEVNIEKTKYILGVLSPECRSKLECKNRKHSV